MGETIGVLVTYFNEKHLLGECLLSLMAQTRQPDEILIYDNASDAPAEDFIPEGCPARVIRGAENRGPSYGRNALLQTSQADYVHFHDADDSFHPEWCRRVHEAIVEERADVVFTEATLHWGDKVSERIAGLSQLIAGKDLIRFIIQDTMGVGVPLGTYRRGKVQAVGGYTEWLWYAEDVDFHVRLMRGGVSYAAIDEPLISLFYREPSHSHKDPLKCIRGRAGTLMKLAVDIPAEYRPDLADKLAAEAGELFRMGDVGGAREAFKVARQIGPPAFRDQRRSYRVVARNLGPEMAERFIAAYRALIPKSLRNYLAQYR